MIQTRKSEIMAANGSRTFAQAREEFLQDKKVANCSSNTLETYKMHLDYFFQALGFCNDVTCRDFKKADWNFFVIFIQNDPAKKDVTVQSYCRTVRAFLNWLMKNDYLDEFKIIIPKAQATIKETYTDAELKALLVPPVQCSYTRYQTWVFINFAISTGLRLSSILAIQTKNYNSADGTVTIQHTKNNLPQIRHLNADMCAILNTYISRFELADEDYLFCATGGRKMAPSTMQENVATYNKRLGVKKTSIHLFRHTFAVKFLENGGTVIDLQRLLGHADITTTMCYVRNYAIDTNKTKEIFNPQRQYSYQRSAKTGNRKRKMQ